MNLRAFFFVQLMINFYYLNEHSFKTNFIDTGTTSVSHIIIDLAQPIAISEL